MAAMAMAVPLLRTHTYPLLVVTHTEIATLYHFNDWYTIMIIALSLTCGSCKDCMELLPEEILEYLNPKISMPPDPSTLITSS